MTVGFGALCAELFAHDALLPHHREDFQLPSDRRALAAFLAAGFAALLALAAVLIYRGAGAEEGDAEADG